MGEFGIKAALETLRGLDEKDRERILGEILKQDPKLAQELRDGMIVFADLQFVNPKGIELLSSKITEKNLAIALRKVDEKVLQHLSKCLSKRKMDSLLELRESLGKQPLSLVEKAQKEIVQLMVELNRQGQILIKRGDDPLV